MSDPADFDVPETEVQSFEDEKTSPELRLRPPPRHDDSQRPIVVVAYHESRRRGRIIERLMCNFAADLAADAAEEPALSAIVDGLDDLDRAGIVRRRGLELSIPPDARPFARLVAARFDSYLSPTATRHAVAV